MKALLTLPLFALAGCATTAPAEPQPIQDREVGWDALCSAEAAKEFVGQTASGETGAAIHRATRAAIFQWVPPDTAVTMDYRKDRVRVSYDRAMVITAVRCG